MTVQLIQGDCLIEMAKMDEKSVDCVITDPPYGIDYQSAWRTDRADWKPKINNDDKPFLEWIPGAYRIIKDTGFIVCFCRWDVEEEFRSAIKQAGFILKSQIIWDKVIHGMGDLESAFAPQHENLLFATKGNYSFPGIRPKSIIREQRVHPDKMIHPNEKPVNLYYKLYHSLLNKNASMVDCFCGSAASGEAAIKFECNYIGIDNSEYYFPLAEKRIKDAQQQMRLF